MSIKSGKSTYLCANSKLLYWGHIPSSQAILKIGHYTSIAENVNFFADGNHRFDHASSFPFYELLHIKNAPHNGWGKGAPTVGNDVWIGRDSKIMSGVHIGDGAVIAAGSIVTKDVEPYSVVGGNPAKFIKYRFSKDIISKFLEIKWWDLPNEFILNELAPIQDDIYKWIEKCESYGKSMIA